MDKTNLEKAKEHANFPPQILIDTISHCNLNCAMCARQFEPRKWGIMPEALCKKIIDEVAVEDKNTRLWFCYFGEPLMLRNGGLFDRIKYAREKGIKHTVINTNGNLMDKACVDKMVDSGLSEVYIGIDATTPGTYVQVRRGGNYELLMKNIDYLIEAAKDKIHIVVQFGVYDENEHEVEEFKQYWEKRGIQTFIRPKLTWINYLGDRLGANFENRHPCSWIFDSLNILETGEVPYCVCDWQNRLCMGDVKKQTIKEIWQSRNRHFMKLHASRQWDKLPEFCQKCPDWQTKTPRDEEFLKFYQDVDENN